MGEALYEIAADGIGNEQEYDRDGAGLVQSTMVVIVAWLMINSGLSSTSLRKYHMCPRIFALGRLQSDGFP
jgi:hypothetical protein